MLWELDDTQPRRYRCHTGHGFTLRSLVHTQQEASDEALWGAMRALQEREALLRALAEDPQETTGSDSAELISQAERTAVHGEQLRNMIESD